MEVAQTSTPSSQEVTWGKFTIEQYAFILAHLLHFPKDDSSQVLERLAVNPTLWNMAVRGWRTVMADEVQSETDTYLSRFGLTFGALRKQLRAERPELKSLVPLPTESVASAPDKPAQQALPVLAPETPAKLPVPAPNASMHVPEPAPAPTPERVHDAPKAKTTSAWTNVPQDEPMPLPPMPAPVPAGAAALGGTSLAVAIPRELVMPFVKGAAPAPIDAPTKNSPASISPLPKKLEPPPKELGGTSMAVAIPRGEALPFARGKAPAPKVEPPKPAPEPPRPVTRTVSPSAAPRVADPPSPRPAAPTQPTQSTQPPQPAPAVRAPIHAPIHTSPPEAPPIPLERHASLCVELAIAPNRTPETLTRYQMTLETKLIADNYWRAQMNHDPETRAAWERAYNVYWEWLVKSTAPK